MLCIGIVYFTFLASRICDESSGHSCWSGMCPFQAHRAYIVTWQAGRAAFSRRRVSIFFAPVLFEFHTHETMHLSMTQATASSSQLLRLSYTAANSIGLFKKRQ